MGIGVIDSSIKGAPQESARREASRLGRERGMGAVRAGVDAMLAGAAQIRDDYRSSAVQAGTTHARMDTWGRRPHRGDKLAP